MFALQYHKNVFRIFSDFDVTSHNLTQYCPYCKDQWCCNAVRDGTMGCEMKLPVIDDRLFYNIMSIYEDDANKYLANVLAASDLIKSIDDPNWELVRDGPGPWKDDHVCIYRF